MDSALKIDAIAIALGFNCRGVKGLKAKQIADPSLIAVVLDANAKALGEHMLVLFSQPNTACGALQLDSEGIDEDALVINFDKLPEEAASIAVLLAMYPHSRPVPHLSQLIDPWLCIFRPEAEDERIAELPFPEAMPLPDSEAALFGTFEKSDGQWQFRFTVEPIANLLGVIERYGFESK